MFFFALFLDKHLVSIDIVYIKNPTKQKVVEGKSFQHGLEEEYVPVASATLFQVSERKERSILAQRKAAQKE